MIKPVCFRLRPWRSLPADRPIGPKYHLDEKKRELTVALATGPEVFRFDWQLPEGRSHPHALRLFRTDHRTPVAEVLWYPKAGLHYEIAINSPSLRGSGLAYVIMNIQLRSIMQSAGSLEGFHTTNTLAHPDSTLAQIGLYGKFGVDCYDQNELERILASFGDSRNSFSIELVSGESAVYYLHYTMKRAGLTDLEFKVFLLRSQGDRGLYEVLANDRRRLAESIRKQEAYLSLPMYVDPAKIENLEAYTRALPELQLQLLADSRGVGTKL